MSTTDERLKKTKDVGREDRAMEDRAVTENREVSDDDRLEMFRQQFFQAALPDLPKIPGYHVCWLTTTNPRDTINMRMRLGYEPVKPEDIPGWEASTVKSGEWQGLIGVNEMLAFKLPLSLYEKYMQEAHHDAPTRELEKLSDTADFLQQQAENSGSYLVEGDGMQDMRQSRGRAKFDLS
ncbi:MAG: hypothetical protein [Caudovirales sp. ctOwN3]|nr:MAG: hypothetical protein [Caudovirales sp. ctOwN3]